MQSINRPDRVQNLIVPLDPARKVKPHWTIERKRRQIRNVALIVLASFVLAMALGTAIYRLVA